MSGKKIDNRNFAKNPNSILLDTVSQGVYVVKIYTNKGIITKKIAIF